MAGSRWATKQHDAAAVIDLHAGAYPVADGHRAAAFHPAHYPHAFVEADQRHAVVAAGFRLAPHRRDGMDTAVAR